METDQFKRETIVTGDVVCANGCEIDSDPSSPDYNPVLGDGYCQSCHEYPEG